MNSMHICSNGGLFNVPIITFIICPFLCFFVLFFRCFFRIFVFVSCVSFVINYLSMLYSFVIHKSCEKSIEGTFLHAKHAINRWQILVIVMAYAFCCCWVDPWRPVACAFVENLSKCGWSEMFTAGWSINCLSHSIWNDSNTRKCKKQIHDSMRVFSWENNVQATLLPSVPLEKKDCTKIELGEKHRNKQNIICARQKLIYDFGQSTSSKFTIFEGSNE